MSRTDIINIISSTGVIVSGGDLLVPRTPLLPCT